jgi:RNA-directed DNA polymerase
LENYVKNLNAGVINSLQNAKFKGPDLEQLVLYAKSLDGNGLPIVFSLKHLSKVLCVKPKVLSTMIFQTECFYRTFSIPKRSGGVREIDAPSPLLLQCQQWIVANILNTIPVVEPVHGFTRNKSIKTNASAHIGCREMLHLDIKDFFPSINVKRVVNFFKQLGYSPAVSFYFGRLCCKDGHLTQGSAASPGLSNQILGWVDFRLSALAKVGGLSYTRYADDITFSGSSISWRLIPIISRILAENGFMVNEDKTRLVGPKGRKIITGISISSGSLKIPKETRRRLRAEVFFVQKLGVWEYVERNKIDDPVYFDRLIGRLSYWRHIEPENKFVKDSLAFLADAMNR